jgi:hexokinase
MPPTGALYSDSAEGMLEDIEKQFHLDTDALISLTRAYLDELAQGLGSYGNSLAMMYASSL